MKAFYIFILLFSNTSFGLPGFSHSMSECEVSYYHFCDELGDKTYNMCPEKLNPSHKDICIINKNQKIDLLNSCKDEILRYCQESRKSEFLFTYTCLAKPQLWNKISKTCLSAISGAHTHRSKAEKI